MSPRHFALAILAFALTACTTANAPVNADKAALDEPDVRRGDEVKRVCFPGTVSGFSNATDYSVVISRGTKDYLITTRSRCNDLDHANALALKNYSSCLSRGDKLIGFDSPFGRNSGPPSSPCYIDKIYEWDPKAKAPEDGAEASSER